MAASRHFVTHLDERASQEMHGWLTVHLKATLRNHSFFHSIVVSDSGNFLSFQCLTWSLVIQWRRPGLNQVLTSFFLPAQDTDPCILLSLEGSQRVLRKFLRIPTDLGRLSCSRNLDIHSFDLANGLSKSSPGIGTWLKVSDFKHNVRLGFCLLKLVIDLTDYRPPELPWRVDRPRNQFACVGRHRGLFTTGLVRINWRNSAIVMIISCFARGLDLKFDRGLRDGLDGLPSLGLCI